MSVVMMLRPQGHISSGRAFCLFITPYLACRNSAESVESLMFLVCLEYADVQLARTARTNQWRLSKDQALQTDPHM